MESTAVSQLGLLFKKKTVIRPEIINKNHKTYSQKESQELVRSNTSGLNTTLKHDDAA